MIHQLRICLRICEIFEETKAAFHARFRDHAARIMRRHSFRILGMWEARAEWRTEFVYLLEWPDEATMRDTWAALMEGREYGARPASSDRAPPLPWADIKRATAVAGAPLVGEIEDRSLAPTAYSPVLTRLKEPDHVYCDGSEAGRTRRRRSPAGAMRG